MRHLALAIVLFAPPMAHAETFERPIPQPQSATAEFWFFVASLALIIALWAVQKMVSRR